MPTIAESCADFCLAAVSSDQAIDVVRQNGGRGCYRDDNPWLVAADRVADAQRQGLAVALLLAAEDGQGWLGWGWIETLTVVGLTAGRYDSRCQFRDLKPLPAIFSDLDSVMLWPSELRQEREQREGLTVLRQHVSMASLQPYGICQTPEFILVDGG